MEITIEAIGLTKKYGSKTACKNIDLSISEGQVFALLGPNGAGKSTIVKSLTGLVRASSGSVKILGRPLSDLSARAKIGFLPELFRYHEWLTAAEVLDFHASFFKIPSGEKEVKLKRLLEHVGLQENADQKVGTFSKGMQQRLGLACALVGDPKVVFLDEPTSALDPLGRRQVREIILGLRKSGTTVFLNSHLLSEVEMVCDRVAFINRGTIVAQGELNALLNEKYRVEIRIGRHPAELIQTLGKFGRLESDRESLILNIQDETVLPAIARTIVNSDVDLISMTPHRHTLEELFVEMVEGRR